MNRYFFDIQSGRDFFADEEGLPKCQTTVVPQVPAAKSRGSPRWRSQL